MSEEEKKVYNFYKECNDNDLSAFEYFSEESKKQIKYMETLLNLIEKQNNRLEQLEKENKELKEWKSEQGCSIQEVYELFIPKSVIREKLEKTRENRDCTYCNNTCNKYWFCKYLKELLGEEK